MPVPAMPMHMKTVTAAIAIKNKHVFLARRAQDQKLAGFWEFPGGKVEPDETLQECLIRELQEEFGVPSTAGAVLCESTFHYDHGSIRLVGIETEFGSTDFQPTVHDRLDWVPLEQVLHKQLAPADIPLAEFIVEHFR
jgi:8-oxo-dGTP diphosphatase